MAPNWKTWMIRLCIIAIFQAGVQAKLPPFSGTADDIAKYDPHDYVPQSYSRIRVAHAVMMSVVFLIVFPVGGIIQRLMRDESLVMVHAVLQMIGFWIVMMAGGLGIWMGVQIDQLYRYHPVIGMLIMLLLWIQPTTEILNATLYKKYPKIIIAGHVHLWLGRSLLVIGAAQGGLGFLFAGEFKQAVVEKWPRIAYGVVAVIMLSFYILVGFVYPEVEGRVKRKWQEKQRIEAMQQRQEGYRAGSVAASQRQEGYRAGSVAASIAWPPQQTVRPMPV